MVNDRKNKKKKCNNFSLDFLPLKEQRRKSPICF